MMFEWDLSNQIFLACIKFIEWGTMNRGAIPLNIGMGLQKNIFCGEKVDLFERCANLTSIYCSFFAGDRIDWPCFFSVRIDCAVIVNDIH